MERHDALYLASMTSNIQVLMDARKKIDEMIDKYLEELANEAWFGKEYADLTFHPDSHEFLASLTRVDNPFAVDFDPDAYDKPMD